jgi:hypothetical protein
MYTNPLLGRLEAIHANKCMKAHEFETAKMSYCKLAEDRARIIDGVLRKKKTDELQILCKTIKKEWDDFMGQWPLVSEHDVEMVLWYRSMRTRPRC